MIIQSVCNRHRGMIVHGSGIVNNLINKLPIELHIPGGYQYCGPGTKLQKRLLRGDPGINPLDSACKEHDISYSQNRENIEQRNSADRVLAEKAWQRVLAKDSSFGEKATAYTIANIMKAKSKLGMGVGKKKMKNNFKVIVIAARKGLNKKTKNARLVIKSALLAARGVVKKNGGKKKFKIPRIIGIPGKKKKVGGALPLIPIFAGLSALGALTGGVSGIVKVMNDIKSSKQQLSEAARHNKTMESIALGKGLYMKPYKAGSGMKLRIQSQKKKNSDKITRSTANQHRYHKVC